MKTKLCLAIFLVLLLNSFNMEKTEYTPINKKPVLFIGTYTEGGKSSGVYVYELDPVTGALNYVNVSPKTTNPSYLVIHPNHKWLYTVNELGGNNEKFTGAVSAFKLNMDKKELELLNTVPSHGNYPCYISVDKSGGYVMTANYGNGSVAVFPIKEDGSLSEASFIDQHQGKGPNVKRQEGPHAHMILQGFNDKIVYNTDLGVDKVYVYNIDTDYNYSAQPGAGPRHLAFHPNEKWVYLVNELNGSVEVCSVDKKTGALTRFQIISTLPKGETGEPGSADIHITPNGKYLYATNRAEINNIAMFAIHPETGELKLLGHQSAKGKTPRNFAIDPSGTFLLIANQKSDNIVVYRIDQKNGLLLETGKEANVPSPVCIKFFE